jgi:hypothetical protein
LRDKRKLFIVISKRQNKHDKRKIMPRGVELATEYRVPTEDRNATSRQKEPDRRALFLSQMSELLLDKPQECYGQPIKEINFNRRFGTLVLGLDQDGVLPSLINQPQLDELYEFGFRPKAEFHITVLNFTNGRRIRSLRGVSHRKKQDRVEKESQEIDWSWQPTGEFYSYQGRQHGSLKMMALVDCPGSEVFYQRLEDKLPGLDLARNPMHITLLETTATQLLAASP